ncbi:MAG: MFS transporter [Gammaproteobacteria bacterium]|nr:MFS transporter [Gammaproteobacteria bacterium]RPG25961.1 MAG: MFS transporter [Gammaproteobacteria bacterium TMED50]
MFKGKESETRALAFSTFRYYLGARFLTTLAVQMQSVAIGWQVYGITGDPLDLGLIGLAQFLPFVVLVLPAGQVADRFNRRTILALCYVAEMICALLLLGFTLFGGTEVWPVFTVLVLFGAARAFAMPSSQAITPNLVPRAAFPNAVAINSSSSHIATIGGPALGGALYVLSPEVVYASVSVTLMLSVLLMFLVRLPVMPRSDEPANWQTLMEGLRFVRSRPIVLGAISLDLFAVLFGGAVALLPAYAADILHVGPEGLGLLRTAPAIGAALIAIGLAFYPITRHVGVWLFAGVFVFGLAIIVFGLSTWFYLSLAALVVMGAGDMVSVYIRHMLVQLETPDEIRGRVSAVNAVFIGASNELGEFESGVTAAWLGLVPAVVIGGTATIAVAGLWTRLFPQLAKSDRLPGETPPR